MIHILAITSTHAIPVHLSYGFMPLFVRLLLVKITHTDVHTKKPPFKELYYSTVFQGKHTPIEPYLEQTLN